MNEEKLLRQQQNEITEYHIYKTLASYSKDEKNRKILLDIAEEELAHYKFWRNITGRDLKPIERKIRFYTWLGRVLGLSFALRLMEKGEADASQFYSEIAKDYPEALELEKDELEHETKLIGILKDDRLVYAGAVVLGLNDALVEFTGTLAGLTFAFANNLIVGTTGLVMGVAASLSMAASGYLSAMEEEEIKDANPVTAAIYTGGAYIGTVLFLVLPYLLQDNPYIALALMLFMTVAIIALYTFYISVAKNVSFKHRFTQMAVISLSVAAISFGIGVVIKKTFGIDV